MRTLGVSFRHPDCELSIQISGESISIDQDQPAIRRWVRYLDARSRTGLSTVDSCS